MITICLNMIVKNESKIITRLFDSVLPIIDTYCICDTGSTDDTVNIIKNYFNNKNIPGKIIYEPFKNFAHNRNFSLHACDGLSDYILLMDADMILKLNNFNKNNLKYDSYNILQGSSTFYYHNTRILKNNNIKNFKYVGVTHEYVSCPPNSSRSNLSKDDLFIEDIGDGGAKSDKYERDVRLLTKGIEEEPENKTRYLFYLANSFYCIGNYIDAIEYYKKRIDAKDWIQEVWFSYYRIGLSYMSLGKKEKAIYYWMLGYECFPDRLENIYEIIKYYRILGKQKLCQEFFIIAQRVFEKIKNKEIDIDSYLFLEYDVYDYKIYEEYLIFSYYITQDKTLYNKLFYNVLNSDLSNDSSFNMALRNHKFYSENISKLFDKNIILKSDDNQKSSIDLNEFNTSTPSLCFINDKLFINIRFVNYKIDDNGNYINKDKIITINSIICYNIKINNNQLILENIRNKETILKYNLEHDGHYVGLEDIRLFKYNDSLMFNANRGINGKMFIEHGSIDFENKEYKTNSDILKIINQTNIEKNWISFVNNNNQIMFIYNWFPINICSYDNSNGNTFINKIKQINSPKIFSKIRGSTNGITVLNKTDNKEELWFICHLVSYEERRFYYHIIVVLDKENYSLKKYSKLFTINGKQVEYILGFDFFDSHFYIGYSILDKSSEIAMISYDKILKLFN